MNSSWQWAEADKRSKSLKRKLKIWAGPCLAKMTKTRKTTKKPKKVILVGRCPLKIVFTGFRIENDDFGGPGTGQGQSGDGSRPVRAGQKAMARGQNGPARGRK